MRKFLAIVLGALGYAAWTKWACAMKGHPEAMPITDTDGRYRLFCHNCGHKSPGWAVPHAKVVAK